MSAVWGCARADEGLQSEVVHLSEMPADGFAIGTAGFAKQSVD